ncbi:MAG: hypothetical protein SGJ04_08435 [Bacteroidota bacterium]|nr:hypothetical protein [Bacteroidota bacterium]
MSHVFKSFISVGVIAIISITTACNSKKVQTSQKSILYQYSKEAKQMSFAADVVPLLNSKCTFSGCHGEEKSKKIKLLTYNQVVAEVVPKDASKSEIIDRITRTGFGKMPLKGELSIDEKVTLYAWVQQGALNN